MNALLLIAAFWIRDDYTLAISGDTVPMTRVMAIRSTAIPARPMAQNGYSEADKALFRMLHAINDDVLEAEWGDHLKAVLALEPGGFLLIRGPGGEMMRYFKAQGWERLPFLWRDRWIFRKPVWRCADYFRRGA